MTITILGLGPGDAMQLTREAWQVLETAGEVYLRTGRHPTVPDLPPGLVVHSFDDLYEQAGDFEQVYAAIAEEVVRLGQRSQGVVYAVPGHPLVGESTVARILKRAEEAGLPVRIVNGISFIEPILNRLGIDALEGLQVADAIDLAARHHPPLNPDVPAIIGQLYSREVASGVKLTLMNQYPDDHLVKLLHAVGTPEEHVEASPLYEIDRSNGLDHLMSLYVPPLPRPGAFETFQETIAHLRAPNGCPWTASRHTLRCGATCSKKRTKSWTHWKPTTRLRCKKSWATCCCRLCCIARSPSRDGEFSMADVVAAIDAKIKRRHPHVFGDVQVSGVGEVFANWEAIKKVERADNGNGDRSALDGVPRALPALAQAEAFGDRASRVGFDWPSVDGVLDKVAEEINEMREAQSEQQRADEFGDLLFALVNVARWLKIDPEAALRSANDKFANRFRQVEAQARAQSRDLKA